MSNICSFSNVCVLVNCKWNMLRFCLLVRQAIRGTHVSLPALCEIVMFLFPFFPFGLNNLLIYQFVQFQRGETGLIPKCSSTATQLITWNSTKLG